MIGLRITRCPKEGLHLKDLDKKPLFFELLKAKAREIKTETFTLALAYRSPATPWYAKVFAAVVVAYAFSPIDLIPDFIPVLGYLDDVILVPLGISLALKMIPKKPWLTLVFRRRKLSRMGNQRIGWLAPSLFWSG